MLKINFSKQIEKYLRDLPGKHAKQIAKKIMALRENPFPADAKKLVNSPYTRTDSGDYRIIYFLEQDTLNIVLVGKRNDGEIYKKLQRLS